MTDIRLIHWKPAEAAEKAAVLEAAGHAVDHKPLDPAGIRKLQSKPPGAIVIDLSRLPSHGREVALHFRKAKTTRCVPIVFVGGDPEKVARIKELLPDAVYTSWSRIKSSLKRALEKAPSDPVVPESVFAFYAGTPLVKKLGIKKDTKVTLAGAPTGFEKTLGKLPEGATLRRQARGQCDLVIWFTKSRKDLERRVERMGSLGDRGFWIVWPKKTSGLSTDLTQQVVRETGLNAGFVDYKICAVDENWSGLRFTRRKP